MITAKEKMVLDKILNQPSLINSDTLDLSLSWEENEENLESGEFWTEPDIRSYGCGMDKHTVAGIFSSLTKKGFITIVKDDDYDELYITETNFNNIVKEYAGL